MNVASCPEMPDLLDHMEGRTDLSAHVVACELCSATLGELKSALDVDAALVASSPLDVERALCSVMARARRSRANTWRMTFFFSAAAAVTLALLLPGNLAQGPQSDGPAGGGDGNTAVASPPNFRVPAPKIPLDRQAEAILRDTAPCLTSTAVIRS